MSDEDYTSTGVIVFYNKTGDYGFIESDDYGDDVLFHTEGINIDFTPTEGVEVEFSAEQVVMGPCVTEMAKAEQPEGEYRVINQNDDLCGGPYVELSKAQEHRDQLDWDPTENGSFRVEDAAGETIITILGVDWSADESDDEENSEADDSDDNTTMAYDNIMGDDEESENNSEQSSFNTYDYDWGLGDHSTASDDEKNALSEALNETMEDIDGDIDGDMMDVLKDAEDLVKSTDISRWECSHEDCGLGHSHSDSKHDIRSHHESSGISGFNITADFAEEMEFCPFCHCGANEAAMLVQFYPYITAKMFKDSESFEGVTEVKPAYLNGMYRLYNEYNLTVSKAAARVANRHGVDESEAIPLGVRADIKAFFARREQMQSQANKAPIAQETRAVIEANRDELEAAVSE